MNRHLPKSVYTCIYIRMAVGMAMRAITVYHEKLDLKDDIETIFEKNVTKFGNGAKVDCPLQFLGKRVYVIVRKSR
jgi:putative transposon-encoded protein